MTSQYKTADCVKSKMSRQQGDVDELFDIKNQFYIGNFQQCINEAQKLKVRAIDQSITLYWKYFLT